MTAAEARDGYALAAWFLVALLVLTAACAGVLLLAGV